MQSDAHFSPKLTLLKVVFFPNLVLKLQAAGGPTASLKRVPDVRLGLGAFKLLLRKVLMKKLKRNADQPLNR